MQVECHSQLGAEEEGESFSLQGFQNLGNDYLKKIYAWETLIAGVVRMKIPMPVWFGVVAPFYAYRGITKNSRTN
jgi:hypothetical protein